MEDPVDPQTRLITEDSPGTGRGDRTRGRQERAADDTAANLDEPGFPVRGGR